MNVKNLETETRKIIDSKGSFSILENEKDESVSPWNATAEYFMQKILK